MESKHQRDRRLPKYPKLVEKRAGIPIPKNKYNQLIINKISFKNVWRFKKSFDLCIVIKVQLNINIDYIVTKTNKLK